MFLGTYTLKLDDKGLTLPAKFRDVGRGLMVTRAKITAWPFPRRSEQLARRASKAPQSNPEASVPT